MNTTSALKAHQQLMQQQPTQALAVAGQSTQEQLEAERKKHKFAISIFDDPEQ